MSYVEENVLQDGESIIKVCKIHPFKLIVAWIFGVLGCWLLFIPTIKAIKKTIKYRTTEYVITNKKVYHKYGLVNKHYYEMSLDKIKNIRIRSTFWGYIFGYGDIQISGEKLKFIFFYDIKKPEEIRKTINNITINNIIG